MKGSFGGTLAMLAVLLTALTFGMLSIPIGAGMGGETSQSVSDLGRMIKTDSLSETYYYNYLPTAIEHSMDQKAYELGKNGGGIEWNQDTIIPESYSPHSMSYYCRSTTGRVSKSICKLRTEANSYLRDRYLNTKVSKGCTREPVRYILLYPFVPEKSAGDLKELDVIMQPDYRFSSGEINITCTDSQGTTRYVASKYLAGNITIRDNRYNLLAYEMNRTVSSIYSEWQGVNEKYTATSTACNSKDWSGAESKAVDKAETDIKNGFSDASSSPTTPGIDIARREIDTPSYTFAEGTTSDILNGTSSHVTSSDVGSCNCDTCYDQCPVDTNGDGTPDSTQKCNPHDCHCDDKYEVKVKVKPDRSTAGIEMIDSRYMVPTENGWKNLRFEVDPYTHWFTGD